MEQVCLAKYQGVRRQFTRPHPQGLRLDAEKFKVGFQVTVTLSWVMYSPPPPRKLKVGFQEVRVTFDLGNVPHPPSRIFSAHFRIKPALGNIVPLGDVPPSPPPPHWKKILVCLRIKTMLDDVQEFLCHNQN